MGDEIKEVRGERTLTASEACSASTLSNIRVGGIDLKGSFARSGSDAELTSGILIYITI